MGFANSIHDTSLHSCNLKLGSWDAGLYIYHLPASAPGMAVPVDPRWSPSLSTPVPVGSPVEVPGGTLGGTSLQTPK